LLPRRSTTESHGVRQLTGETLPTCEVNGDICWVAQVGKTIQVYRCTSADREFFGIRQGSDDPCKVNLLLYAWDQVKVTQTWQR
jgi:hypothetical protein